MIKSKIMALGNAAEAAKAIVGTLTTGLTAAGSTQGTALLVSDDNNVVTTAAASTGVILRSDLSAGDVQVVANYGANTLSVYPPVGGKINNGTLNAAVSLTTLKAGEFICLDGLNFIGVLSA